MFCDAIWGGGSCAVAIQGLFPPQTPSPQKREIIGRRHEAFQPECTRSISVGEKIIKITIISIALETYEGISNAKETLRHVTRHATTPSFQPSRKIERRLA